MQQIDLHNYEAYLLDYSEGNLSDELQMKLELFLIQHPELNINLNELAFVSLNDDQILFSQKDQLKKTESDLISQSQFVAYIENQLPATERTELEKSCNNNPSLANELKLYQNTIAKPDMTIEFSNKQTLKRKPKVIWFNVNAAQYAAAACVLFLIGLFVFWPKPTVNTNVLANNKEKQTTQPPSQTISEIQESTSSTTSDEVKTQNKLLLAQAGSKQKTETKNNTGSVQQPSVNTTSTQATNNAPGIVTPTATLNEVPKQPKAPEQQLASVNKPKTVVQVISESDDELLASNEEPRKKGIWGIASRALKNLNNVGVKSVDGDETTGKQNEAYALTVGGLSITHKTGKL